MSKYLKTKNFHLFVILLISFTIVLTVANVLFFCLANLFLSNVNAKRVAEQIQAEGSILLKNDNNLLPLQKHTKVSVFGQNSVDFVRAGTSGGVPVTGTHPVDKPLSIRHSLDSVGLQTNPTLWNFYEKGEGKAFRKDAPHLRYWGYSGEYLINEVPQSKYTQEVKNSFKEYNDVAIVTFGRIAGEGAVTHPLPQNYHNTNKSYLELEQAELDLLEMVNQNFKNIVVILNTTNVMQLDFIEKYSNIQSVLWVGTPGSEGLISVAKTLVGDINPSGRLVDTYAYNLKSAPAMQNFGDFDINLNGATIDGGNEYANKYVNYAEGIYIGYKYYETRYEDTMLSQGNAGNFDYDKTVIYPFGYGLSYSTFAYSNFECNALENAYQIRVKVTNTGKYAGKESVQLYLQKPYTNYDRTNGIEKASVQLVGFAKTKILQPNESEVLTINVNREDLYTYDSIGKKSYILESGKYYFTVAKNAHEAINQILVEKGVTGIAATSGLVADTTLQVPSDVLAVSNATNQFDSANIQTYFSNKKYLTRNNWLDSYPQAAEKSLTASQSLIDDLNWYRGDGVLTSSTPMEMPKFNQKSKVTVKDAIGKSNTDPIYQQLVEKLTKEETLSLIRLAYCIGYEKIGSINLPRVRYEDGPSGITTDTTCYPNETVVASTFNVELVVDMGRAIGEVCIKHNTTRWSAPGLNMHRTPFSERNYEYYSEDSFLCGKMATMVTQGAQSRGVIVIGKHFALNDSEINRFGVSTFAQEQAIREIYLKPFEMAVKDGKMKSIMTAFNRIGARQAASHRGLITEVLRNEWGFLGYTVTDYVDGGLYNYHDLFSMLWAGANTLLNDNKNAWAEILQPQYLENAVVMTNAQNRAKEIIFTIVNSRGVQNYANGKAIDVMGAIGEKVEYKLSAGFITMLVIDSVFVALASTAIVLLCIDRHKYKMYKLQYTTMLLKHKF